MNAIHSLTFDLLYEIRTALLLIGSIRYVENESCRHPTLLRLASLLLQSRKDKQHEFEIPLPTNGHTAIGFVDRNDVDDFKTKFNMLESSPQLWPLTLLMLNTNLDRVYATVQ